MKNLPDLIIHKDQYGMVDRLVKIKMLQRMVEKHFKNTILKIECLQLISFFLSEDIMIFEKVLYTVFDLLSDFGGLYSTFVLTFFVVIGSSINKTIVTAKIIRAS